MFVLGNGSRASSTGTGPKKLVSRIAKPSDDLKPKTKSGTSDSRITRGDNIKPPSHSAGERGPLDPYSFKLSTQDAQTLLQSADGMRRNSTPGLGDFPDKEGNQRNVAFDNKYQFNNGEKNPSDGKLDFAEQELAVNQLIFDKDEGSHVQVTDPITDDNAKNAANFIASVHTDRFNLDENEDEKDGIVAGELKPGLDTDNDNAFTKVDIALVATFDGNADEITTRDFEKAAMREKSPMSEASETLSKIEVAQPQD